MDQPQSDLRQRTKVFAINVIEFCEELENTVGEREIAKQLVRSAMLIGLNTKAAFSGRVKSEYVLKLEVVIEEAAECQYWFELLIGLEEGKNGNNDRSEDLLRESTELLSIFISLVKKYKTNS